MTSFIIEFLFNGLVDHLMPLEFDGLAHVKLSETDPRLQLSAVLRWELENIKAAIRAVRCRPRTM